MQQRTCPICAIDALEPLIVGKTSMLRCKQCRVVITPSSDNEPTDYYEQGYSLTSTTRASTELHRYFRYPEYQYLVGLVNKYAKPSASILDVGCDHGFFLDDARRFAYTVAGVEPSERGRQYAQSIGLNVQASLNEVDGMFDVVTLWHVLEHIQEPVEMIRELTQRMNPGARMLIRVPDFGSVPSRLLKDRWIWFQPHHHAVHYTRETLPFVLSQAGLTVQHVVSRRPNSLRTRKSYNLSVAVMHGTHNIPSPGLRGRTGRLYQDITGVELLAIARYKDLE